MSPIKAENRRLYPPRKEWMRIRKEILTRAGDACETCGRRNGDYIRDPIVSGARVVLTIAHLDQNPENNDAANLKALCQRCHNRHDLPFRAMHARETRARKRAAGTGDMFAGERKE